MKPKISVIMPIYNVEKYIADSIKSICMQTLKNFEIILVDDGSSDHSIDVAVNVLYNYSIPYKVIHQNNSGVSVARNIGIKNASGEWIICIDADDCIHPQTIEILSHYAQKNAKNADIIAFDFCSFSNWLNTGRATVKICELRVQNLTNKEIAKAFLLRKIKLISPGILIRKMLVLEKSLFYDEDIRFSEDQLYIWKLILNIQKVCYINFPLYYYRRRANSTMTASSINKIMTGYYGFERLTSIENKSNRSIFDEICIEPNYIFARWIIGVLHAVSKYMKFSDFCVLATKMNYKDALKTLTTFPDKKVCCLRFILLSNKHIFWMLCKIV